MSLFDMFLLLCILIVSAYTYTKTNVMIIETYRGNPRKPIVSKTEKRLNALESIVKTHTRAISAIQGSVNYLINVIGYKETKNKKSLFQRIIDVEEEMNEEEGEGGADNFEYQLPEA